ncbi:MAG: hypothetical protein GY696_19310, partial [Gammaproteobacteria bacterium]|nr:hypothetical protein [Gammaproteobacteria bacterium]
MSDDGRRDHPLPQGGRFRQRIGPCATRLRGYFEETRGWLAEDIDDEHANLLILRNDMEVRVEKLRKNYRSIQAQDQEWVRYVYGLEAGDFATQEIQEQVEYAVDGWHGNPGYVETVDEAEDLEIDLLQRIQRIDRLRQAPVVVRNLPPVAAPPDNPPVQQEVPPGPPPNEGQQQPVDGGNQDEIGALFPAGQDAVVHGENPQAPPVLVPAGMVPA